jgi:hypothetical protein
MLDVQLFLRPQLLPHSEHSLSIKTTVSSESAPTSQTNKGMRRITMFLSATGRIYDGGPIRL